MKYPGLCFSAGVTGMLSTGVWLTGIGGFGGGVRLIHSSGATISHPAAAFRIYTSRGRETYSEVADS